MTPPTDEQLAEWQQATTPAPWEFSRSLLGLMLHAFSAADIWLMEASPALLAALREARAETAELRARIEALCDEVESAPFRGRIFGGELGPAILNTEQVRAALSPALWPARGSAERAAMFAAIRDDPNYPTTYATRCDDPDHCDRMFHYSRTRPQR